MLFGDTKIIPRRAQSIRTSCTSGRNWNRTPKNHVSFLPFMAVVISLLAEVSRHDSPRVADRRFGRLLGVRRPVAALVKTLPRQRAPRRRPECAARNLTKGLRGIERRNLRSGAGPSTIVCTESRASWLIRDSQRDLRSSSLAGRLLLR